ncbi:MAG: hypothetical protein R2772_01375 [Chitinophagales bacterium]
MCIDTNFNVIWGYYTDGIDGKENGYFTIKWNISWLSLGII